MSELGPCPACGSVIKQNDGPICYACGCYFEDSAMWNLFSKHAALWRLIDAIVTELQHMGLGIDYPPPKSVDSLLRLLRDATNILETQNGDA